VGAAATAAAVIVSNLGWGDTPKADLAYLSPAKLVALDGTRRSLLASELWAKNGAVIMVVRRPG